MKRRMQLESWHRRLVAEGPANRGESVLFALLVGLSLLYGGVLELRALLYRLGVRRRYRAPVPVISVGNLTAGGTGKTPITDLLVKALLQRGRHPAVVSRGYGREVQAPVEVVSRGTGPELDPQHAGDEPYLLARRNPLAIVVVAARRAAGIEQAVRLGADVIVLDDAFQHLAVARDLDIVLLDAQAPLGNGMLLPAGVLREFPAALQRASLAVVTRSEAPPAADRLRGIPLIATGQGLAAEGWDLSGRPWPRGDLAQRKVGAFCGIADPEKFFRELERCGVTLQRRLAFPDHVCYDVDARRRLAELAAGLDVLVTTEKDAVKLAGAELDFPCIALPLEVSLLRGEETLARRLDEIVAEGEERTMALSEELLEILACPACKGEVAYLPERQEIRCPACKLAYPVRDEIPVMLIDEARPFEA